MGEWRAIACAVDLSEESHAALREAAELARRTGARLTVFHVLRGGPISGAEPLFAPPARTARPAPDGHALDAWTAEAERVVGRPVSLIRVQGSPAEELLRLVEEQGCDLVVLGKHPRAAIPRLLRRSIGERVARGARVPVLLVPGAAAHRT